jgi:hypothetical protein
MDFLDALHLQKYSVWKGRAVTVWYGEDACIVGPCEVHTETTAVTPWSIAAACSCHRSAKYPTNSPSNQSSGARPSPNGPGDDADASAAASAFSTVTAAAAEPRCRCRKGGRVRGCGCRSSDVVVARSGHLLTTVSDLCIVVLNLGKGRHRSARASYSTLCLHRQVNLKSACTFSNSFGECAYGIIDECM